MGEYELHIPTEEELNESDDKVLTVTQLTGLISTMLENSFQYVTLKGEISNYRPNASGHMYFVLKDSSSQISAVMFRGRAASLNFTPKDGCLVQVSGKIQVYGPMGKYQIVITSMTQSGMGGIMEKIEKLKQQLYSEGLFDQKRKKHIPYFPRTIGVVTSPTGAAIKDILQIAGRRNDKINFVILPSLVQGDGAAKTIVHRIKQANKYKMCDVLIVGRGGGSLEDLLPFSDEGVCRAIAESEIPVVSAVGHEIDWALSDFVADMRAPTPSAAAELLVPSKSDMTGFINQCVSDMKQAVESRLSRLRAMVKAFTPDNMELSFRRIEQPLSMRFDECRRNIEVFMNDRIENSRALIKEHIQTLENCNPQSILDRGYSMVTDSLSGKVIRSADQVSEETILEIKPAKGKIKARVI